MVDIVVASVLGVAAALVFFAWNALHTPLTAPIEAGLPGAQALLYGVWLFAGVLGGLIIRKPGAALFTELVAAAVSALLGNEWGGFLTIQSGLVQGLGAELVFLIFLYSYWRIPVAILAGAGAGFAMGINDNILWNIGATSTFQFIYLVCAVVSGAVIAGLGSWFVARGLARTGVLSRFAAGRTVERDARATVHGEAGRTAGKTAGGPADSTADTTAGEAAGRTAGGPADSAADTTADSTTDTTAGEAAGTTADSIAGKTAGSTAGRTAHSTADRDASVDDTARA